MPKRSSAAVADGAAEEAEAQVVLTDPDRWPAQHAALSELRRVSETHALGEPPPALGTHLSRISHGSVAPAQFGGIEELVDSFEDPRAEQFWAVELPCAARLAMSAPGLFEAPLRRLRPGVPGARTLSREQAASVIALALFDAIPGHRGAPAQWDMPDELTLRYWCSTAEPEPEKLLCVLEYFRALASPPTGAISIRRLVLTRAPGAGDPSIAATWTECDEPLRPLAVRREGAIENEAGALQADFANEYIGGGVMRGGNVQEEIRFTVCPECLVSMLLCPRMRADEAVLISGVVQYARYEGYGGSFRFAGGMLEAAGCGGGGGSGGGGGGADLLAIDATQYIGHGDELEQYAPKAMLRELTKLWAGLGDQSGGEGGASASKAVGSGEAAAPAPFASGNWGCGIFGGDPQLKACLQWLAASRSRRDLVYFTFGDPRVDRLEDTARALIDARATVGELARALFGAGRALGTARGGVLKTVEGAITRGTQ